ncbi:winged helix-turn-helix transcriptional regulator [Actinacidiphila acididurans]|uniref:Helix-turn-helix transcriptional regulator n=1 Tax=Actinacidiphila acididurans TaxID=2784346 RepID=A0ABS2TQH2_9ACTN|nr:helix-turn-helix transcriptional regulator [Actinacidiphila acididurans]
MDENRRPDTYAHDHHDHCETVLADCRLRAGTELFAHTWDPVVLAALSIGPLRRSRLLSMTGGMSDKVLTDTLRRLLANGLVARLHYPAAPPRVEYQLTALGTSLVEGPMRALGDWAVRHGDELLEAQERAARSAGPEPESPPEPDPVLAVPAERRAS